MSTQLTNQPVKQSGRTQDRVQADGRFFTRYGQPLRIRGVTYGPFAPDAEGHQFPAPQRVVTDFAAMQAIGVNAIRTYHPPPPWLLDIADDQRLNVLVDVPWPKHLCFLDSKEAQREARQQVKQAAARGREHSSLFAYSIGNEIPPDIARWHGAPRVERFLAELMDVAHQEDPQGLVTFANFPPTEYLDLSFLDFATFNVYLHELEKFRAYLFRLQNMVGDKPLLLGEIGMDTMRHGEQEQAEFLRGHLREATLMGLAGAFVFAWTDDWYTGGYQIEDWAFGVTQADRTPKASSDALSQVFGCSPAEMLPETPRVSVVVCSYNGGPTLEQCLRSLLALDYPDYEIILVDDGSTDNTPEIATRFPTVRTIHQANQGLSVARNVGLQAATGSIVAYTDSDCFAHADWLTHLVYQLQRSGAAAVGGPNLTPDDGPTAACVAASPGQPTHVLENDQIAEHIPGCNMAFRKEALEAINGFNPKYRKAGDDVDACWRLQQSGQWITFAPGAFVWHHRRQNPRAYLRQQAGYGEAEALLWFEHPDHFNRRGEGIWRGEMYGGSPPGLRFGEPMIYRGIFGTGLFQTLYQPEVAYWATLPSTLEWHLLAVAIGLMAIMWAPFALVAAVMLAISLTVAGVRAAQAPLAPEYRSPKSRLTIATLSYVQPLMRSWWRYRTRFFPPIMVQPRIRSWWRGLDRLSSAQPAVNQPPRTQERQERLPLLGSHIVEYWDEEWRERTELLDRITECLSERRVVLRVDPGWSAWDVDILLNPWSYLRICTAQEDHGSGKRLFRVRYQLFPRTYAKIIASLVAFAIVIALRLDPLVAVVLAITLTACMAVAWWRGSFLGSQVMAIIDAVASEMGLIRCDPASVREQQATMPKTINEEIPASPSVSKELT